MKVKFKVAWRHYKVGQVIEPPGVLRDWLMQEGFIVPLDDEIKVTDKLLTREIVQPKSKKKAKRKTKAKVKKAK